METFYTASAVATGEGRNGHVQSTDGFIDTDVRVPRELGGAGGATNPEQLFAAGTRRASTPRSSWSPARRRWT